MAKELGKRTKICKTSKCDEDGLPMYAVIASPSRKEFIALRYGYEYSLIDFANNSELIINSYDAKNYEFMEVSNEI